MNNGINFPTDNGPQIEGKWYNPATNDVFVARDTFFQDNQLIVQTTDGRMLDYNTIQNYVKVDDKFVAPKHEAQTQPTHQLPQSVANIIDDGSEMLPEDQALLNGAQSTTPTSTQNDLGKMFTPTMNEDQALINRVLKRTSGPNIKCNIAWDKYPEKQIDCLANMMGIELNDICSYYINQLNINELREILREQLLGFIEDKVYPVACGEEKSPTDDVVMEYSNHLEKIVPKKPGRPVKKTTKK